jgi:hypothetical protein
MTTDDDKKEAAPTPSSEGAAVFDFSDLQALREEYEERIARLTREAEGVRQAEARQRQDLIQELTIELAGAREEGERRAIDAEKRRMAAEGALLSLRNDVMRVEGELARIRGVIDAVLAIPQPAAPAVNAATGAPLPTGLPSSLIVDDAVVDAAPAPPPLPADAAAPAATPAAPARKRKIRLR